ncbi:arylsulfatase-like [Amphiura filiformis]|uniref:arylsulfatase-like n=1 Tax=Amphiura filiformis TaxID=82378 RepID=UPI003B21D74C
MAWSVGAIMEEVKRLREKFNTISIFTSVHGTAIPFCNEAGDAGVLKGGKFNFWEGGVRVPGIVTWPGHIKPGSTSETVASQLDIFPTLINITGGSLPDDRIIDGIDISSALFDWSPDPQPEPVTRLIKNKEHGENNEPRLLVFYCSDSVYAVRYGSYKFHFISHKTMTKEETHADPGLCGDAGYPLQQNLGCRACGPNPRLPADCIREHDPPLMYNIDADPNEAYPLDVTLSHHEAVFDEMILKLDEFKADMNFGPPLLGMYDFNAWPCCTPETYPICTCNYEYEGPDPPPGNPAKMSVESLNEFIQKVANDEYDGMWAN